jgi:hypothetical protein
MEEEVIQLTDSLLSPAVAVKNQYGTKKTDPGDEPVTTELMIKQRFMNKGSVNLARRIPKT